MRRLLCAAGIMVILTLVGLLLRTKDEVLDLQNLLRIETMARAAEWQAHQHLLDRAVELQLKLMECRGGGKP